MIKLLLQKNNIMPSSAYHQFFLGILLQNNQYIKEVYNKQIGMMYDKKSRELSILFGNEYDWYTDTGLKIEGFIIENSWDMVGNGLPDHLPDLIREKLSMSFYVKYSGDIYYIQGSYAYKEKHLWTDIFMVGYDENGFIAVGKTKKALVEEYYISEEEVVASAIKREGLDIYNPYTYNFELNFYQLLEKPYTLDLKKIKTLLMKYLNPKYNERYCMGVDVYSQLLTDWEKERFRVDQLLYICDHVCLMRKRIDEISQCVAIPIEVVSLYYAIEKEMTNIAHEATKPDMWNKELLNQFQKILIYEQQVLKSLVEVM